MKNALLAIIIITAILYCFIAFITWEINPAEWHLIWRIGLVLAELFMLHQLMEAYKENKNPGT